MINPRYRLNISFTDYGFKPLFRGIFLAIKSKKNNLDHSRIGVVLSKKYSKKATARNKLKRDVFRFFAGKKDFLELKTNPRDIIIIFLTTDTYLKDNKEAFNKELENVLSL